MNDRAAMQGAQGPAVLSCQGLSKRFHDGEIDVDVLRGIDLQVHAGETLAIVGASGSGKSTLLHLLGGLDVPNAGEVWFRGSRISGFSERERSELRNRHFGFIFQAYHLFPELDALENVCLPGRMARRPYREVRARAEELLRRVGLGERFGHRPAELSGGEQQRVAIARALINDPVLILADEPTGNLDSKTGDGIMELLSGIRSERNTTLVIATHDSRVAGRARRVLELADGLMVHPEPAAAP